MIEREKLQHLIENIGIPKLCLILLLGISLIIVSIPSGKTKKNTQSSETTAKEEKQNQIKEQITTLFSQYDLKVLDVDSKVNEKGTIEKIDIKTDKLRHTKKLKTAISNFYNMKESNINISE